MISNVNLRLEFLNKAVKVADWRTKRLVSPQIIFSEIRKKCTLNKLFEYFTKKKRLDGKTHLDMLKI